MALNFSRLRAAFAALALGLSVAGCGYNTIPTAEENAKARWADVQNQYQRRADLIPNLVETVKGYAKHEGDTLERVVLARNKAASPHTSPVDQARDENALTREIRGLFLLKESYPELKASRHFLALQEELATTENRIQRARRFYNANVRDLANLIESFPSSVLANMYGFRKREFFEIEDASERALPQVDLS